jgi:aminoglycoside phosphotransferase (APT) family kinase protein
MKKWREFKTNIDDIDFKYIKVLEELIYPHCGNDVVECNCLYNGKKVKLFIKIERHNKANFKTEVKHLNLLKENNLYNNIPTVIESGYVLDKKYVVLTKVEGERLSTLLKEVNKEVKEKYLYNYGKELSLIHDISPKEFDISFKRDINDIPKDVEEELPNLIKDALIWLKGNKPEINNNTFIHGDFHYANVLWKDKDIAGVLDWEYSGRGFKEQDIAWSLILRPSQKFMDNINDINIFLKGYKEKGSYDKDKLKWCYINGLIQFYLMNKSDLEYRNSIINLLNEVDSILF